MDVHLENDIVVEKRQKYVLNRQLFELMRQKCSMQCVTSVNARKEMFNYISNRYCGLKWNSSYKTSVESSILNFSLTLTKNWNKSFRNSKKFLVKYKEWLDLSFCLPQKTLLKKNYILKKSIGRPIKNFKDCGDSTKRRKTSNAVGSLGMSSIEIHHASQHSYFVSGQKSVGHLIKEATSSAKNASNILKTISNSNASNLVPYTAAEALAFFVENDLTKRQYVNIRLSAKERKADIYPAYNEILMAKKECYPERCIISETRCEVVLQDLLDHTVQRIFQIPNLNFNENCSQECEIIYKWGCDGSNGQSQYKQLYNDPESTNYSDGNLFLFSLVPLELHCFNEAKEKNIIWNNKKPSSTRFCRPIKYMFEKETIQTTLTEVGKIEEEIKNLTASRVIFNGKEVIIKHILLFTMIDGKVCNSLTETSSQKCFICGASPKQMNDIDNVFKQNVNHESFKYGLSSLHAWIRFMECLLHVSYKLECKKWAPRDPDHKLSVQQRKKQIQDQFRLETGLLIDVVLQGKGNTNDGNTARRFFKNTEVTARITGIDINIIKRFANILSAIASGREINADAFNVYAFQTAKMFTDLYPWYYMPASVHKVLIHGADVIRFAILPIGQLSEDAQEARNKDYRQIRLHHTRKNSRHNTNEDLLHMLLVSSDPFISSMRKNIKTNVVKFSDDVENLFIIKADSIIIDDCSDDLNASLSALEIN